jgi:hypothetical protein
MNPECSSMMLQRINQVIVEASVRRNLDHDTADHVLDFIERDNSYTKV